MNFRELEDVLIDRIIKREGGIDTRKMLMKSWRPRDHQSPADLEKVRYRVVNDPVITIEFEDAVLFRRSIDRSLSQLEPAEAEKICRRAGEFKSQLRGGPLASIFLGKEGLKDLAARHSVYLAYVLTPALSALGRFADAVRLCQYFVKYLTRPEFRDVFGAMDEEFRFGLIGAPISELVAFFPPDVDGGDSAKCWKNYGGA